MLWYFSFFVAQVLTSDWWSGLLEHSIFSSDWWKSVLQGSVGGVLSLVGLFLVFWLTRNHDLDRDERARKAEKLAEVDRRTSESVANFQMFCLELMADDGKRREDYPPGQDPVVRLLGALVIFSLREAPEYPNLDKWLTAHIENLTPWLSHKDGPLVANVAAAAISGTIAGWVSNGRRDDSERIAEASVSKVWEVILEQLPLMSIPSDKGVSRLLRKSLKFLGQAFRRPARAEDNARQSSSRDTAQK